MPKSNLKIYKTCFVVLLFLILGSCSNDKEWIQSESKIDDGLHDIEIIDEKNAFSYTYGTGKLYNTSNGGKTWELIYQFDSIYFEQIQFIDRKTGWIAGSPNKLFKSSDGGKSWDDVSIKNVSESALIYGLFFKSFNEGYVALIERVNNKSQSSIYQSKNAGQDWELIGLNMIFSALACITC